MNVFDLLKQDHQRVRDLFSQIAQTESRNKQARQQLFHELKRELIAHAHAEEKAFYPALIDQLPTHDRIEEGINEHHQVEGLLNRMEGMTVQSDEWLDAVKDLEKMVEHHVREEEDEVFPKAQTLLPKDQFDPLGDQVKLVEEQEKRSTH